MVLVTGTAFSTWTFSVLVAVLVGAWAMLAVLMRRWTTGLARERLLEWAGKRGMVESNVLPAVFGGTKARLEVVMGFASADAFVLRVRANVTPVSKTPGKPSEWTVVGVKGEEVGSEQRSALRPTAARVSFLDLYALGHGEGRGELLSYPSIPVSDAFVLYGSEKAEMGRVARLAGELPGDLGLLLAEGWVVVDCSARPFVPGELTPVLEIARKLRKG